MQRFEALTPHFEFRVDVCTGKTETLVVHSDHTDNYGEGEVAVPVSVAKFTADSWVVHSQYKKEPEWVGVHGPVFRINTEFGYYYLGGRSILDEMEQEQAEQVEQAEQAELDAKLNALRAETRAKMFAMASDSSDDE